MKLTCADTTCERPPMRERNGQRYCMWHPDQTAPDLDLLTGKLRGPDGKPKKDPKPSEILRPSSDRPTRRTRPSYRAPGRVITRQPAAEAPTDGLCSTDGCDRPWKHRGPHRKPKPTPAEVAQTYAHATAHVDQIEQQEPQTRTWSNTPKTAGRGGRKPNPLDPVEAARRYQNGEGLFALAADLHVGANTLRRALADQGVQLRKRGDVIGTRGPTPTPINPEQVRRLYVDQGLTTVQIASQLHVKTSRIQDLLRQLGLLRPPGGRHPGAGGVNSVRLKLGADLSQQVRLRAASLGQPIGHYLRDLVLADLAQTERVGGDA
jgi:hypothetical protein